MSQQLDQRQPSLLGQPTLTESPRRRISVPTGVTYRQTPCFHSITSLIFHSEKQEGLPLGNQEVQIHVPYCKAALSMFATHGLLEKTVWNVPHGFFSSNFSSLRFSFLFFSSSSGCKVRLLT